MPPRGIVLVASLKPNDEFKQNYQYTSSPKFQKFTSSDFLNNDIENKEEEYITYSFKQKSSSSEIFKSFRSDLDASSSSNTKTNEKLNIKEKSNI